MKRGNCVVFLPWYLLIAILCIGIAVGTDQTVQTVLQRSGVDRDHIVIIDPGHGGVDGGATSCTGVLESQLNLEISLRLNEMFKLLGHKTKMIRTEDISVYTQGETIAAKKVSDLRERTRIVNETDDAVLISIHQNTFSDSRYGGAQVFYPKTDGSQKLAEALQNALIQTVNPDSHRKAKKAQGVYLMEHIEKPGVLVECGFLSNPGEEFLLRDSEYQKHLCAAIAVTVSTYLSNT